MTGLACVAGGICARELYCFCGGAAKSAVFFLRSSERGVGTSQFEITPATSLGHFE